MQNYTDDDNSNHNHQSTDQPTASCLSWLTLYLLVFPAHLRIDASLSVFGFAALLVSLPLFVWCCRVCDLCELLLLSLLYIYISLLDHVSLSHSLFLYLLFSLLLSSLSLSTYLSLSLSLSLSPPSPPLPPLLGIERSCLKACVSMYVCFVIVQHLNFILSQLQNLTQEVRVDDNSGTRDIWLLLCCCCLGCCVWCWFFFSIFCCD